MQAVFLAFEVHFLSFCKRLRNPYQTLIQSMPFLLHSLFIRKSEVFSKEKVLALQPVFTESYQHMVQSNNIFCMRRLFTLCALALCSLAVMATTYNGKLTVSINGEVQSSSQAAIDVADQGNGKFDLTLADFITTIGGNEMPVGTIRIAATGTAQTGYTLLSADQNITIENGSNSGKMWVGPTLGQVPVKLLAKQTAQQLYAVITIQFGGMDIRVQFGEGYQVPNADFERFTASNGEPDRWHSFMSVTGTFASSAKANAAVSSTDTRPGSTGEKSLLVKSRSIDFWFFKVIANGTVTTGRLMAGSSTASNTKNNSFLDLTKTDKDANGDPFYTEFSGRPDRMVLWVKFKQGEKKADHPYATVKAVVTDGSYYQLPEDKTYTNKMAQAIENKIADTQGAWKKISIPFDYVNKNVTPKAVLVTMSTNADAGEGSGSDELYVDDLSFEYDFGVDKITLKGTELPGFAETTTTYTYNGTTLTANDVEVTTKGAGTLVAKEVKDGQVKILVASDDLLQSRVYTINVPTSIKGISSHNAATGNGRTELFDLNGVRVKGTPGKGIYIIKDEKGQTRKVRL